MDLRIDGKVALVAGASSGIGKAIAEALASEGAKVAILSRDSDRIKRAAADIEKKTGKSVMPVRCDVTGKAQIEKVVKEVTDKLGAIQILVCNAGGPPSGKFEDFADSDWDSAYELNLKSTILLCMNVLQGMKENKWGRIINLTSVAALQPIDNLILSNTTRAGVHGFTKTLSNEVAGFGVTVNCICPGFTDTERLNNLAEALSKAQGVSKEKIREGWEQGIPAGRLGRPDELGALAAYLASEQAGYVTGLAINIDGGYVKSI